MCGRYTNRSMFSYLSRHPKGLGIGRRAVETRQADDHRGDQMSVRDALQWLVPTTRTAGVNDLGGLLTQFKALMATRRYAPPAHGQRPRVAIASFGAGANHLMVDC